MYGCTALKDWYREITHRLLAADAGTAEERERVYSECRVSAPPSEAERLEVAIRRLEQQALLETPAPRQAPSSPAVGSEPTATPRALWWAPWIRPN